MLLAAAFLTVLKRNGYTVRPFDNVTPVGITTALACSVLFYLTLDRLLNPIIAWAFPASEKLFQESAAALTDSPVTGFIHTCIIAPVMEECLMRGIIADGMNTAYGALTAVLCQPCSLPCSTSTWCKPSKPSSAAWF